MGRGRETAGGRDGRAPGEIRESSGRASGEIRRIPQLREPPASPGPGRMFPRRGRRRGVPREPGPWWDGPRPCPPPGHEDTWDGPPWDGPPWDGPPWDEPPWEHQDRMGQPRGPGHFPWKEEEDRSWGPHECPPRPPWDDREDFQGFQDGFEECWYLDPPPDPWPEFPEEEQRPPWPPAGPPRNPGAVPPWSQPGRRRPRRSRPRQLTQIPRAWCPRAPRAPRGHRPHSKPSPAPSKRSQPAAGKELQPPGAPQPPAAPRGAAEGPEQPQDVPAGSGDVLEPPGLAGSPLQSPADDPGAAEPPVELDAVGSQEQDPCALGTDPAPPEISTEEICSYPEIQEPLEAEPGGRHRGTNPLSPVTLAQVEPCSPGVPKAGTGHGSHPQSLAAPPEPSTRELLGSSSSGEAGAELSPHSWEQPPRGAGEGEAEAARDGVSPGSAAEPEAQPSQAAPAASTTPETSPCPQCPPGSGETNPAGIDFRSAVVLAKTAEIELSYQQFSLMVAVVATMLLQKEPSMEAALGLALRANLRQRRLHHLQELEEFINSYDLATASL
ncbi:proline-rich protein 2-like isoform X2 [Prinia subflava]|uniref:proline-rich protein 2-like isoform X2 n=1 Tax=Prinia subflava TaxID=208062 RepID=UPI002FE029AF